MHAATLLALASQSVTLIRSNVAGLNHSESLVTAASGGSCANWVLGHIVVWRNEQIALLGGVRVWAEDYAPVYRGTPGTPRASTFSAAEALPYDGLKAAMERTHERFAAALDRCTPESLSALVGNGSRTVGAMVLMLLGHEVYHAGQLGMLRRVAGMAGAI